MAKKKLKSLSFIRFAISAQSEDTTALPDGIDGNPDLMMWKELCRTGTYVTGGTKHVIDEEFLQNIVDVFFHRKEKGIEVPCPKGHVRDPEARRGTLQYVELRKNDEGGVSLYGVIEFVDAKAKQALSHSGVSIEAPEVLDDGDGETYRYGLEHVAFTDYPVVAGMSHFEDVTFSIESEPYAKHVETFDALVRELGIQCNSPADAYQQIYDKFQKLEESTMPRKKKFAEGEEEQKEEQRKDEEFECGEDEDEKKELAKRGRKGRKFSEESDEDEEKKELAKRGRKGRKFSDDEDEEDAKDDEFDNGEDEDDYEEDGDKGMGKKGRSGKRFSMEASLLQENRSMKIDSLLSKGHITASQANYLRKLYCSEQAVRFSIDSNSNREFNNTCKLLSMGLSGNMGECTGAQFSIPGDTEEDNVMTRAIASRIAKKN